MKTWWCALVFEHIAVAERHGCGPTRVGRQHVASRVTEAQEALLVGCSRCVDSSFDQQSSAADLGSPPIESPQRLLASLRCQCDVKAVREVCRSLAEQLQRDLERALAALAPERVQGRIVYFGERMQRTHDGSGYGKTVAIRWSGAMAAAKLGAVAVLIRSVGTDSNRLPHTGSMGYEDTVTKIPAAALAMPDADLLEQAVASGRPVRFRLRLTSRMLPEVESANVVGELAGRERPEEIVILSGHLDSWDLGTGALDDAAGIGNVIEAARLISKLPSRPRRTIRIVLYSNEEFGLSGGKTYAVAHAEEVPLHQAALESCLLYTSPSPRD